MGFRKWEIDLSDVDTEKVGGDRPVVRILMEGGREGAVLEADFEGVAVRARMSREDMEVMREMLRSAWMCGGK